MTTEIIDYATGTCVPCSGTGLRDADTVCPTCDGSGGRVPVYAPEPAVEAVPEVEPEAVPEEVATGGSDGNTVVA